MRGPGFIDQLETAVPGAVVGRELDAVDPWLEIAADKLLPACRWLKDSCEIRFDGLQCITAVDWFEPDAKKAAKVTWEPHTELVYHLWSTVAQVRRFQAIWPIRRRQAAWNTECGRSDSGLDSR